MAINVTGQKNVFYFMNDIFYCYTDFIFDEYEEIISIYSRGIELDSISIVREDNTFVSCIYITKKNKNQKESENKNQRENQNENDINKKEFDTIKQEFDIKNKEFDTSDKEKEFDTSKQEFDTSKQEFDIKNREFDTSKQEKEFDTSKQEKEFDTSKQKFNTNKNEFDTKTHATIKTDNFSTSKIHTNKNENEFDTKTHANIKTTQNNSITNAIQNETTKKFDTKLYVSMKLDRNDIFVKIPREFFKSKEIKLRLNYSKKTDNIFINYFSEENEYVCLPFFPYINKEIKNLKTVLIHTEDLSNLCAGKLLKKYKKRGLVFTTYENKNYFIPFYIGKYRSIDIIQENLRIKLISSLSINIDKEIKQELFNLCLNIHETIKRKEFNLNILFSNLEEIIISENLIFLPNSLFPGQGIEQNINLREIICECLSKMIFQNIKFKEIWLYFGITEYFKNYLLRIILGENEIFYKNKRNLDFLCENDIFETSLIFEESFDFAREKNDFARGKNDFAREKDLEGNRRNMGNLDFEGNLENQRNMRNLDNLDFERNSESSRLENHRNIENLDFERNSESTHFKGNKNHVNFEKGLEFENFYFTILNLKKSENFKKIKSNYFFFILENNLSRAFMIKILQSLLSYNSINTPEFIKLVKEYTGKEMTKFFEYYVYKPGIIVANITFEMDRKGKVDVYLKQSPLSKRKNANKNIFGELKLKVYENEGIFEHKFINNKISFQCHLRVRKKKQENHGIGNKTINDKKDNDDLYMNDKDDNINPLMYMRADPTQEHIIKIILSQPDFMYVEQLYIEKNIFSQIQCIQVLAKTISDDVFISFEKILNDNHVFYKVRLLLLHLLSQINYEEKNGYNMIIQHFTKKFCLQGSTIPKPNDFSSFSNYFLQKGFISSLGYVQPKPNEYNLPSNYAQPKSNENGSNLDYIQDKIKSYSGHVQPNEYNLPSNYIQPKSNENGSNLDFIQDKMKSYSGHVQSNEYNLPSNYIQPKSNENCFNLDYIQEAIKSNSGHVQPNEISLSTNYNQPREMSSCENNLPQREVGPSTNNVQPNGLSLSNNYMIPKVNEISSHSDQVQPKPNELNFCENNLSQIEISSHSDQIQLKPNELNFFENHLPQREVVQASGNVQPNELSLSNNYVIPKVNVISSHSAQVKLKPNGLSSHLNNLPHREVNSSFDYVKPKEISTSAGNVQPKPNEFISLPNHVNNIAENYNEGKKSTSKNIIISFLKSLLKYNSVEDQNTYYNLPNDFLYTYNNIGNSFYISQIIDTLALHINNNTSREIDEILKISERLRTKDIFLPSFQNTITISILNLYSKLHFLGYIEIDCKMLIRLSCKDNYVQVRKTAIEIICYNFLNKESDFIFKMLEKSELFIKIHILKTIYKILAVKNSHIGEKNEFGRIYEEIQQNYEPKDTFYNIKNNMGLNNYEGLNNLNNNVVLNNPSNFGYIDNSMNINNNEGLNIPFNLGSSNNPNNFENSNNINSYVNSNNFCNIYNPNNFENSNNIINSVNPNINNFENLNNSVNLGNPYNNKIDNFMNPHNKNLNNNDIKNNDIKNTNNDNIKNSENPYSNNLNNSENFNVLDNFESRYEILNVMKHRFYELLDLYKHSEILFEYITDIIYLIEGVYKIIDLSGAEEESEQLYNEENFTVRIKIKSIIILRQKNEPTESRERKRIKETIDSIQEKVIIEEIPELNSITFKRIDKFVVKIDEFVQNFCKKLESFSNELNMQKPMITGNDLPPINKEKENYLVKLNLNQVNNIQIKQKHDLKRKQPYELIRNKKDTIHKDELNQNTPVSIEEKETQKKIKLSPGYEFNKNDKLNIIKSDTVPKNKEAQEAKNNLGNSNEVNEPENAAGFNNDTGKTMNFPVSEKSNLEETIESSIRILEPITDNENKLTGGNMKDVTAIQIPVTKEENKLTGGNMENVTDMQISVTEERCVLTSHIIENVTDVQNPVTDKEIEFTGENLENVTDTQRYTPYIDKHRSEESKNQFISMEQCITEKEKNVLEEKIYTMIDIQESNVAEENHNFEQSTVKNIKEQRYIPTMIYDNSKNTIELMPNEEYLKLEDSEKTNEEKDTNILIQKQYSGNSEQQETTNYQNDNNIIRENKELKTQYTASEKHGNSIIQNDKNPELQDTSVKNLSFDNTKDNSIQNLEHQYIASERHNNSIIQDGKNLKLEHHTASEKNNNNQNQMEEFIKIDKNQESENQRFKPSIIKVVDNNNLVQNVLGNNYSLLNGQALSKLHNKNIFFEKIKIALDLKEENEIKEEDFFMFYCKQELQKHKNFHQILVELPDPDNIHDFIGEIHFKISKTFKSTPINIHNILPARNFETFFENTLIDLLLFKPMIHFKDIFMDLSNKIINSMKENDLINTNIHLLIHNERHLDHYYDVIRIPMDYNLINQKLENNEYFFFDIFLEDIERMLSNSIEINYDNEYNVNILIDVSKQVREVIYNQLIFTLEIQESIIDQSSIMRTRKFETNLFIDDLFAAILFNYQTEDAIWQVLELITNEICSTKEASHFLNRKNFENVKQNKRSMCLDTIQLKVKRKEYISVGHIFNDISLMVKTIINNNGSSVWISRVSKKLENNFKRRISSAFGFRNPISSKNKQEFE